MRPHTKLAAFASFSLALALAPAALAQEGTAPPPSAAATPWEAGLGYRGGWVESAGYAPFSARDYLSQMTLEGSRVVLGRGRLSVAVGAAWDYGSTSTTTRGSPAGLTVHRLTAPVTARYRLARWLDAYASVAPGAAFESAYVDDPSAPGTLRKKGWVPCGDATAGVAWAFARTQAGGHFFVWRLRAEGGYGWTGSMSLDMAPELAGGDNRSIGTTDLGSLALGGGFGRIAVVIAF